MEKIKILFVILLSKSSAVSMKLYARFKEVFTSIVWGVYAKTAFVHFIGYGFGIKYHNYLNVNANSSE